VSSLLEQVVEVCAAEAEDKIKKLPAGAFQARVALSPAGASVRELNTCCILRSNSSRVNGFDTNTA